MSLSAFIAPLVELAKDDFVQEKAEEAAKQFFTNNSVTINLLPALIAGALALLLAIPLLALLFQPAADDGGSGYGAPAAGYGAPEASYGAPEQSYEAPESSYGSYRSDEGFSEYRSLFTNLLDSADPQFSLTKRMQQVAGPAIQTLGDAAAKLIQ